MENLSAFFQDSMLTSTVVFGAISTVGILDRPDQFVAGGEVQSTAYELLVKTGDFPVDPVYGDSITVASVSYVVNHYVRLDDGKIAKIGLSKV
jgi:hypothetical protein